MSGCSERSSGPIPTGDIGNTSSEVQVVELATLQPLGTVITLYARERVVTVLVDVWIDRLPENIEIITRTPDGTFSGILGNVLLKRRRVHTYAIESGKPIAGDLVFYRIKKEQTSE